MPDGFGIETSLEWLRYIIKEIKVKKVLWTKKSSRFAIETIKDPSF